MVKTGSKVRRSIHLTTERTKRTESKPQAVLTTDFTDENRIEYTKPNPTSSGICAICKSADNTARKDRLLEAPHSVHSVYSVVKIPILKPGTTKRAPPSWSVFLSGSYLCNLWSNRFEWFGLRCSIHVTTECTERTEYDPSNLKPF